MSIATLLKLEKELNRAAQLLASPLTNARFCVEQINALSEMASAHPSSFVTHHEHWVQAVAGVGCALLAFPDPVLRSTAMSFLADVASSDQFGKDCATCGGGVAMAMVVLRGHRDVIGTEGGVGALTAAAVALGCCARGDDLSPEAEAAIRGGGPEVLLSLMDAAPDLRLNAACAFAFSALVSESPWRVRPSADAALLDCMKHADFFRAFMRGMSAPRDGSAVSAAAVAYSARALTPLMSRFKPSPLKTRLQLDCIAVALCAMSHWRAHLLLQFACCCFLGAIWRAAWDDEEMCDEDDPQLTSARFGCIDAGVAALRLACAVPRSRRELACAAGYVLSTSAQTPESRVRAHSVSFMHTFLSLTAASASRRFRCRCSNRPFPSHRLATSELRNPRQRAKGPRRCAVPLPRRRRRRRVRAAGEGPGPGP